MRRRFIQDPKTLDFVEVTAYNEPDAARCDAALWGDRGYDGLRATDGADIGSRSKQREYMKRHGLTTVDDYGSQWRSAEAARLDIRTGRDPARAQDIARVIAQLERGNR